MTAWCSGALPPMRNGLRRGRIRSRCQRLFGPAMSQTPNEERKTLILTGASRGIGHATVKRFSSAGWRVITCSRHGFPEDCPWEAGPEDHIQVDLSDPDNTMRAIAVAEGARRQAERAGQQRCDL